MSWLLTRDYHCDDTSFLFLEGPAEYHEHMQALYSLVNLPNRVGKGNKYKGTLMFVYWCSCGQAAAKLQNKVPTL